MKEYLWWLLPVMASLMHAGKMIHALFYKADTWGLPYATDICSICIAVNTYTIASTGHIHDYYNVCVSLFHSQTPASSPLALTVGGTREGDNLYYITPNSGTNFGRCVDIFAPGQSIRSAGFSSRTDTDTFSGTSQATPLVSGAAAIYWNRNRNAGPRRLKNLIISACTRNRIDLSEIRSANQRRQTPNCLLFV